METRHRDWRIRDGVCRTGFKDFLLKLIMVMCFEWPLQAQLEKIDKGRSNTNLVVNALVKRNTEGPPVNFVEVPTTTINFRCKVSQCP